MVYMEKGDRQLMENNEILAELFSASKTDSEHTEIRRKNQNKSNGNITTYDVVAHIEKNNQLNILDRQLSESEIDFIRRKFCK